MHPILRWTCFVIFTIYALIYGHFLLTWIRPNTGDAMYVTESWIIVTQIEQLFNIQVVQKWRKDRNNEKWKLGVPCLCIVWKFWDLDQSISKQSDQKKSTITIFDFALLRSIYGFDRGQPTTVDNHTTGNDNHCIRHSVFYVSVFRKHFIFSLW